MTDFFRWSPRTPTTGYFLATLRVAEVSQLYECPRKALALGLTLTGAPQFVEGSRLIWSRRDRINTTVAGPCWPNPPG